MASKGQGKKPKAKANKKALSEKADAEFEMPAVNEKDLQQAKTMLKEKEVRERNRSSMVH